MGIPNTLFVSKQTPQGPSLMDLYSRLLDEQIIFLNGEINDFSTGYVSPVSVASSTNKSLDSIIRQSPGIISPPLRIITSPGTISSTGISFWLPSRSTIAFICTIASNFSIALAAPRSCQNPRRPLMKTIARIMNTSTGSFRKNDNPAAKRSMRVMGLLN